MRITLILPWTSAVFAHLAPTLLAFLQRTAVLSLPIYTDQNEQLADQSW